MNEEVEMETIEDVVPEQLGNAKKMREALNEIQLVCSKAGITIGYNVACGIIKAKSRAALSAPPRNCDVGTMEEQSRRCDKFCDMHDCGSGCPLFKYDCCELAWLHMPYEEVK